MQPSVVSHTPTHTHTPMHTHTHPRVDVDWGLGFVCHFCVSTSSSGNLNFPLLITVALKGIKRISGDLIAPPAPPPGSLQGPHDGRWDLCDANEAATPSDSDLQEHLGCSRMSLVVGLVWSKSAASASPTATEPSSRLTTRFLFFSHKILI